MFLHGHLHKGLFNGKRVKKRRKPQTRTCRKENLTDSKGGSEQTLT